MWSVVEGGGVFRGRATSPFRFASRARRRSSPASRISSGVAPGLACERALRVRELREEVLRDGEMVAAEVGCERFDLRRLRLDAQRLRVRRRTTGVSRAVGMREVFRVNRRRRLPVQRRYIGDGLFGLLEPCRRFARAGRPPHRRHDGTVGRRLDRPHLRDDLCSFALRAVEEPRKDVGPVIRCDHLRERCHAGQAQPSVPQRLHDLGEPLDELSRRLPVVGRQRLSRVPAPRGGTRTSFHARARATDACGRSPQAPRETRRARGVPGEGGRPEGEVPCDRHGESIARAFRPSPGARICAQTRRGHRRDANAFGRAQRRGKGRVCSGRAISRDAVIAMSIWPKCLSMTFGVHHWGAMRRSFTGCHRRPRLRRWARRFRACPNAPCVGPAPRRRPAQQVPPRSSARLRRLPPARGARPHPFIAFVRAHAPTLRDRARAARTAHAHPPLPPGSTAQTISAPPSFAVGCLVYRRAT